MNNDEVIQVFKQNLEACRNNKTPRDQVFNIVEDLVANRYDWSKKKDWQSKNPIPKFAMNQEKFAAEMQRAIIQAADYFVTEGKTWSEFKQYAPAVTSWIKSRLDQQKFPFKFVLGSKISATRGRIYFKPHIAAKPKDRLIWPRISQLDELTGEETYISGEPEWETIVEQELAVELVHPRNIWHDPTGRNRFLIESWKIDKGELVKLAEEGHYDLKVVKELSSSSGIQSDEEQEERDRHEEGEASDPNTIELFEYWGDLYDLDGRLIDTNMTFTVANKDYLVRKPRKNPYWHGKFPYVWGAPVVVPFSNYDKSFLEDSIGLQKTETEFVNLILDSAKYAVAGAFTLDVEQVVNVNDYRQGIFPGIVAKYKGSWTNGRPPLESIKLNTIDPMALSVLQMIDRYGQIGTGVNDLMMGVMPARRSTAKEGAMRMSESSSLFDTYARNLEEQLIGPLVEQVWALDLQYYDWNDKCARDILGEEFALRLANMTDEERYQLIEHFEFKGKGISVVLSKAQELEKVDMVLSRFGRYPNLAQRVNMDKILEKVAEALSWDPKEMLLPPGQTNMPPPGPGQQIPQTPLPAQGMPQGMPGMPQGMLQGMPQGIPPQMMMGGGPNG